MLTRRCERPLVEAVFIGREQAEADLDRDRQQQGDDAERAERRVADAAPAARRAR